MPGRTGPWPARVVSESRNAGPCFVYLFGANVAAWHARSRLRPFNLDDPLPPDPHPDLAPAVEEARKYMGLGAALIRGVHPRGAWSPDGPRCSGQEPWSDRCATVLPSGHRCLMMPLRDSLRCLRCLGLVPGVAAMAQPEPPPAVESKLLGAIAQTLEEREKEEEARREVNYSNYGSVQPGRRARGNAVSYRERGENDF